MTTFSDSVARLGAAQKAPKGPAYTRFVNRRIGRYLAAGAHQAGLTPNQVSLISFGFSLSGLVLATLVRPTPASSLMVSGLLAFGFALDSADGQLARLRGSSSSRGEWVDHVLDCAKVALVHLAVLVVAFRFFDLRSAAWYLVPMAFLVVGNLIFFGGILTEQLKRGTGPASRPAAPAPGPGSTAKSLLMLPVDYGALLWSFALLFAAEWFRVAYGALFLASVAFLVAYLRTWYRELS